jgi:hypothetical protein
MLQTKKIITHFSKIFSHKIPFVYFKSEINYLKIIHKYYYYISNIYFYEL